MNSDSFTQLTPHEATELQSIIYRLVQACWDTGNSVPAGTFIDANNVYRQLWGISHNGHHSLTAMRDGGNRS